MTQKLKVFSWLLFDFANTAFSVMMVTFAFPLYFKNVICGGAPSGDAMWGISVSVSMLFVAVISPVLGAASDYSGRRKRYLFFFTLLSVVATALLGFSAPGMAIAAALLFILANMGFEGGLVFYDAYLKEIASDKSIGRVSGYGFAMGYLGSLTILLLMMPLLSGGIVPQNASSIRTAFMVTALFFAIFSLPLFVVLRDEKKRDVRALSMGLIVRSIKEVKHTVGHIMHYPDLARFLLAYFFYNDAILTIIAFSSIYAQNTLAFTTRELIIFFMLVQTTAIVGSVVFGFITDWIGPKRTIVFTLMIWFGVVLAAVFADSKVLFFATGMLAGMAMGSSQAASRSMMAKLTPREHVAEFFGFYDGTFGKASAIVGPLVFGMVSAQADSQKAALSSLLVFFVIGLVLMLRVRSQGMTVSDQHSITGATRL
ncbi:MAG: MFS transporter [Chlorobium limicola]|uniref:Major facilitator superfamily MFS_1 n=1 Tax=Chlorobium limicola (strain DSM 245 / NBRC 103803 / 6330) TaxID=290315 RepID=B3EDE7_CHLL2|nr:MFS transporter [Chlorobium limicola]ACD90572.1 major facilitator superfamily MFS_1 [Chlorobium limicola DSM 245]NTV07479.1 MFS transporter [Chlorobium limicola]NTV20412.1 MFS transporter [Chlorobium limicola]